jgi:hypothetical protein
MKKHIREKIKNDLRQSIDKVLQNHIDSYSFTNIILPESITEMLTDSAMNTLDAIHEYHKDLVDGGYLSEE